MQATKADPEALLDVRETVAARPVVLYALEWCEFCWSVRRMFQDAGIEYLSVDLDGAAYRADNRGGRIRAALREITGSPTIPQIFVNGEHLGGPTNNNNKAGPVLKTGQHGIDE